MKHHAEFGHDALLRAEMELGTTDFLQLARKSHIPITNAGMAAATLVDCVVTIFRSAVGSWPLADVYDALINRRSTKAL